MAENRDRRALDDHSMCGGDQFESTGDNPASKPVIVAINGIAAMIQVAGTFTPGSRIRLTCKASTRSVRGLGNMPNVVVDEDDQEKVEFVVEKGSWKNPDDRTVTITVSDGFIPNAFAARIGSIIERVEFLPDEEPTAEPE